MHPTPTMQLATDRIPENPVIIKSDGDSDVEMSSLMITTSTTSLLIPLSSG